MEKKDEYSFRHEVVEVSTRYSDKDAQLRGTDLP